MELFKRYVVRKQTFDGDSYYVSIGLGATQDIAKAHLYTELQLAKDKLEDMWRRNVHFQLMEVLQVIVQSDSAPIFSKERA